MAVTPLRRQLLRLTHSWLAHAVLHGHAGKLLLAAQHAAACRHMMARSLEALLLLLSAGSCLADRRLLHGGHAHEEGTAMADAPAAGVEPMPTGHVRNEPTCQASCVCEQ